MLQPSLPEQSLVLALVLSLQPFPALAKEPPKEPLSKPKATEVRKVTDTYHNVTVVDDYRWLENAKDPQVARFTALQNRYSRESFDRIPSLPALQKRVKELTEALSVRYFDLRYREKAGRYFARKFQPPREQPVLLTLESLDDAEAHKTETVLLDPVQVNPKGTTTIDFYVPSLDGELVAVSLSDSGTEDGTVHVYETRTGRKLPDVIPRVHGGTAGGSVAWVEGGFYYTRYPRKGERPPADLGFYQQVYFHKLGDPTEKDTYALGDKFPPIAETRLISSEDGLHVLAEVANGDGGEYAHYLLGPKKKWEQLTRFSDQVLSASIGRDGSIYFLSRKGAPRGQVLRAPLSTPWLGHAQVVIPKSDAVIEAVIPLRNRIYVVDLVGGVSQMRAFDGNFKQLPSPSLPKIASVGQVLRLGAQTDEILYSVQSFTMPPAFYRLGKDGSSKKLSISMNPKVDFSDIEVTRHQAKSKDGTLVPLSILRRKGTKLNGGNPTLLTGYGGFGISLTPHYQAGNKVWLEQGGVMAIANLRGGGEYGEDWHKAGNLKNKQNVFDDFIACAKFLIDGKFTSPGRLGIEGGSNGGLLVAAVATQRPDLMKAVVAYVGLYDMLRFETYPNGAFNVTEYGSVSDPALFAALYAYSPYHRVKDGVSYPAMLFLSGENDPRVNPADSRKMVARLQAATSGTGPILLRSAASSGHKSSSLSESILETADTWAFLFEQLGVDPKGQKVQPSPKGQRSRTP